MPAEGAMIIARSPARAAAKAGLEGNGCVVTIGNFDGVHIGHQAMLGAARERADELKLPLLVLSFDPHPEAYFSPETAPPRLSSLAERVLLLKEYGVDIACVMPFVASLASLAHDEFVNQILCRDLNARCVVIGDDFHYGKGRAGNASTLHLAAQEQGFEFLQIASVMHGASRVSSTEIRSMLAQGKLDQAAHYLGRWFNIIGRVVHGDARGRTWGFPTLNLVMRHRRALKGVFAVSLTGLDGRRYQGVANLGKRPTVGGLKTLLEVHLFDYAGDAYGERVCVNFHHQIRQEQKFDSFELLKRQIHADIIQAKACFETTILKDV